MTYSLGRVRILVVDDSTNMRHIIRRILRVFGLREVKDAEDGEQALSVMQEFVPDLVITNWEMSPMSGLDFVRSIRSRTGSPNLFVPIIMVTGHAEMIRVIEARNAGVNEFLTKPLSAKALYARILRVIDNPRQFVDSESYFGPDRRFRSAPFDGQEQRTDGAADEDEEPIIDWEEKA